MTFNSLSALKSAGLILRHLCCYFLLLSGGISTANATERYVERYIDGIHYQAVEAPEANGNPNNDEVIEFFSYGCPHCWKLEPVVKSWLQKQGDQLKFTRVPATWNSSFKILGRMHFALEALGLSESKGTKLFEYIHVERKPIQNKQQAQLFFNSIGVSPELFSKHFNGMETDTKMVEAETLFRAFKVSGVPAFVINGRYMTSVSMAGSEQEVFEVVDFLRQK